MNEFFQNFRQKYWLIAGWLLFSLLIRLWIYQPSPPGWDGAVYVLMGKYLFSSGQIGFIEPFRPILWPVLLGGIWKLGGDPIVWGRIAEIMFSLGNIVLIYLIGHKVYDQKIALIAACFASFAPSYFFWATDLYADIPGSFLGLFVVYLFFQNQPFWAGIMGGLAFFMRFTQLIPLILLGASHAFTRSPFRVSRCFVKYVLGLIFSSIPFLIVHVQLYGDMFYPFKEAEGIYGQIPATWHRGILFCVQMLFKIESWIFAFVPLSLLFLIRSATKQRVLLFAIGLLSFIWVGRLPTYLDLPRFFIVSLPYLYLLSADGIRQSHDYVRKRNTVLTYFLMTLVVIFLGMQWQRISKIKFPSSSLNVFQRYVLDREDDIRGSLWISDPTALSFSELKVDELMYYPVFDLKKISNLQSKLKTADYIFWDSRALVCRPHNDFTCEEAKGQLLDEIRNNFKAEVYLEDPGRKVVQGIFKRLQE